MHWIRGVWVGVGVPQCWPVGQVGEAVGVGVHWLAVHGVRVDVGVPQKVPGWQVGVTVGVGVQLAVVQVGVRLGVGEQAV